MLNDHQTLRLKSLNDGKDIEVEVNFSDQEQVKNCQVLRLKYDGKTMLVKQDDLLQIMLVIGSPETQKKLIPVTYNKVKKIERLLTFEFNASKDYRKGDKISIKAPWIEEVVDTEAAYAGAVQKKKGKAITSSGIIVPNSIKK